MPLSVSDWHERFLQQIRWTENLRDYLYPRAGLEYARRVLDVGCGTGVSAAGIRERSRTQVFGLDINRQFLNAAAQFASWVFYTEGDASFLPYAAHSFDLTQCHFLLLWAADPVSIVREMARVTRPGGAVLALAEPDYGGRIDYPQELSILGNSQKKALSRQGADPLLGRRLGAIFHAAGLENVEWGVLGGQWKDSPSSQEWASEWAVLQQDLNLTEQEFKTLRSQDRKAWERGERVLYVPTFYAWARAK